MGRTTKDYGERKKISWRMKRERRQARQAKEKLLDDRDTEEPRRLPPGGRLWRGREHDESK